MLLALVDPASARAPLEQMIASDPRMPEHGVVDPEGADGWLLSTLCEAAVAAGVADRAYETFRARMSQPRGYALAAWLLVLRATGRTEEAIRLAQASVDDEPGFGEHLGLAYVAAVAGKRPVVQRLLKHYTHWEAGDCFERARVHAALGEKKIAIGWYGKALEQGFPNRDLNDPELASLEDHPDWDVLRERFPLK